MTAVCAAASGIITAGLAGATQSTPEELKKSAGQEPRATQAGLRDREKRILFAAFSRRTNIRDVT
jgi:hypothetical protein